jgi:hypothetical protein
MWPQLLGGVALSVVNFAIYAVVTALIVVATSHAARATSKYFCPTIFATHDHGARSAIGLSQHRARYMEGRAEPYAKRGPFLPKAKGSSG